MNENENNQPSDKLTEEQMDGIAGGTGSQTVKLCSLRCKFQSIDGSTTCMWPKIYRNPGTGSEMCEFCKCYGKNCASGTGAGAFGKHDESTLYNYTQ